MEVRDLLESLRNDRIEFVTMRPPGSAFAVLERRVVVSGPPELVALSESGDPQVLDALVAALEQPEQAWAAVVLLAAMTRTEEDIVSRFSTDPEAWLDSLGKTAHARWSRWLEARKGSLVWDSQAKAFVEAE